MAKLKAPEAAAPVYWRGEVYKIRGDGSVDVPDEASEALLAHGFLPWPREARANGRVR